MRRMRKHWFSISDRPKEVGKHSLLVEALMCAFIGGVVAAFVTHALIVKYFMSLEALANRAQPPAFLMPLGIGAGAIVGTLIPIVRRRFRG